MAGQVASPKLLGYWRSSASWRVRIALALKEAGYEYVPVHLLGGEQKTESYTKLNPMAQVPTFITAEGVSLTQSLAIIEYLEETLHSGQPLLPADPIQRAHARAFAEMINSELGEEKKMEWAKHWIGKGMAACEQFAKEHSTASRFCVGDQVSVADCCLPPQMYACRRFSIDVSPYPTLCAIEAHISTLPAFVAAHADNQPDKDAPIPSKST